MAENKVQNPLVFAQEITALITKDYPFLSQWRFKMDSAKKRAGSCQVKQKVITLSRYHIAENSLMVVKDTILHELAHAICFEVYGDLTHGKKWKAIASSIGAVPKATAEFNVPYSPWKLVVADFKLQTVSFVANRFRKNKKIKNYYLKADPKTKGRLFYLKASEYEAFKQDKIGFSRLNLMQE